MIDEEVVSIGIFFPGVSRKLRLSDAVIVAHAAAPVGQEGPE